MCVGMYICAHFFYMFIKIEFQVHIFISPILFYFSYENKPKYEPKYINTMH